MGSIAQIRGFMKHQEQRGELDKYLAQAKKYGVGRKGALSLLYYYLMYTPASFEKCLDRCAKIHKEMHSELR